MNLTELSARYGIATHADGRTVPESTLRVVLEACGAFDDADTGIAAPAAVVTRQSDEATIRVVNARAGASAADAGMTATLTTEDGGTTELEIVPDDGGSGVAGSGDGSSNNGSAAGAFLCRVPSGQPTGYHVVDVMGADDAVVRVKLIVAPDALNLPGEIGSRRHWGYDYVPRALRSELSWAVGDFADTAEFARLAADDGASFVSTPPLNAPSPTTPINASPYAAATRQFLDPLLIRVEDIREVAYMPAATRSLIDWEAGDQHPGNTSAAPMDLDELWEAKKNALSLVFAHPRSPARQAALESFVERGGPALDVFSRWCAAVEYFGPDDAKWPSAVRAGLSGSEASATDRIAIDPFDRENAALEDFRRTADDRRDFYAWLQWVADTQLRRAAGRIAPAEDRSTGTIGLVRSTVVSAAVTGADAWRYAKSLAPGVLAFPHASTPGTCIGPGSATLSPGTLRALGFAPIIESVRAALRHGGGLRLDRPNDLFAAWWVPDGAETTDGARVAMDADELIGIVILEAQRAGAVVMAGDSSGLSDDQRAQLADRGIAVPTNVWDVVEAGTLPAADTWPADAVAVVSPHGPVPTSAYLSGEHLDSAGVGDGEEARVAHGKLREAVVSGLRQMSFIDSGSTEREILEALYSYVASTPARFVTVAVADAVGDRHPVFGVPAQDSGAQDSGAQNSGAQNSGARNSGAQNSGARYPDWRMPLADGAGSAVTLARLVVNPRAADLVRTLSGVR